MGEDHRSLFTQQPLGSQSPGFNVTSIPPFDSSGLNTYAFNNVVSSQEGSPISTFPRLPHSEINQHQGWSKCLPCFRQAFAPVPNYSALGEKLAISCGNSGLNSERKFLVFDQSGDQTTIMVSSGPGTPLHCITSWTAKQSAHPNVDNEAHGDKLDRRSVMEPAKPNDLDDNLGEAEEASEMHEDTEELNALLYSDDEDESYYSEENDEVASTGHSPSTMTTHEKLDNYNREDKEHIASSIWSKKRKCNWDNVEVLDDTASSSYLRGQSNHLVNDGGAEFVHAKRERSGILMMGLPSPENRKIHREKIRKTVELLQEMIPGVKGKDTLVVLDEAIDYLKSLKVRARSLGLATL
ncbi:hypothetical protein SAY87_014082 [Trapa incisa]|uniref:BHLH domain-containing protein n=2 Tax=Trapa TaxID=22665 RepID=A0AAN7MGH0_TRANT|nr:hypothetical protein SAY87_014082 [Trapa incisa]KAK4803201.1 hypothetical protein SAY86_001404 [Trapa natans]